MLFHYDYLQAFLLVLTYIVIYNLTSLVLFATIMQIIVTDMKTLFSFSTLGSSNYFTKILALAVLSLAGVPPLVGFFSKVFVFVLVANSTFVVLFPSFFTLLFIGLYFYIQNLRFLNATNAPTPHYMIELSLRTHPVYFSLILPLAFLILFGFCYLDDIFILGAWLLY